MIAISPGSTVIQYPYRTAHVADIIVHLDRRANAGLEEELAREAKSETDNHVVYQITRPAVGEATPKSLFIQCTDSEMWVGLSIINESW